MAIEGKRLKNNARYTQAYLDTHDVETGGWKNDELGQAAKATGNTDKNWIIQDAKSRGREIKEGSHGGLIIKPKKNALAESAVDNGASKPDKSSPESVWGDKKPYGPDNPWRSTATTGTTDDKFAKYFPGQDGSNLSEEKKQQMISRFEEQNPNYGKTGDEFTNAYGYSAPDYMTEAEVNRATGNTPDWHKQFEGRDMFAQEDMKDSYNPPELSLSDQKRRDLESQYRQRYQYEYPDYGSNLDLYNALIPTRENPAPGQPRPQEETKAPAVENPVNVVAPNPYRDQSKYGYNYSPASPYVSGQPRTPSFDYGSGHYFTPESTPTMPTAQEVDDAYSQYKAMTGADNRAGYDAQEDRKYSYDPYTVYNSRDPIAEAVDRWQQNRGTRNALGAQTYNRDQQFEALYNELRSNGLTQADIMSMIDNGDFTNLSPEDSMMLYYYAMNH